MLISLIHSTCSFKANSLYYTSDKTGFWCLKCIDWSESKPYRIECIWMENSKFERRYLDGISMTCMLTLCNASKCFISAITNTIWCYKLELLETNLKHALKYLKHVLKPIWRIINYVIHKLYWLKLLLFWQVRTSGNICVLPTIFCNKLKSHTLFVKHLSLILSTSELSNRDIILIEIFMVTQTHIFLLPKETCWIPWLSFPFELTFKC